MKTLVWSLLVSSFLHTGYFSFAQGCLGFANSPLVPVIDGRTGQPAKGDSGITVGLYYTLNLSAPVEDYLLAATTHIIDAGVFNNDGMPACLEGVLPGERVRVVVKAWTGGYASYEEAWASADAWLGVSDPTMDLPLAGPGSPPPNLVIAFGLRGFAMDTRVPEPNSCWLGLMAGLGSLAFGRIWKRKES